MTVPHLQASALQTQQSYTQNKSCKLDLVACSSPPPERNSSQDFCYSTSPHLKTYLESLHSYLNAEKMASTEKIAMTHFPKASTEFAAKLPLIGNENAFLGDIACSFVFLASLPNAYSHYTNVRGRTDSKAPISAGFYRLEPGTPLVYDYTYHEMKIIVSGSFDISDETGNKVHAVAGDVFYFPKGSKITFTTEEGGLAFYTGQRAEGAA
jgi:uncharacterized cupin superfamily protein